MLKSLCGLRKSSKSKGGATIRPDVQDFSTAESAIETASNDPEACTLPKIKKLLVADRDLVSRNRIKAMGGTHSVNLYKVGNNFFVCKEYPAWISRGRISMENEVFAYKFSKKLGLDLVPETTFVLDNNQKIVSTFIKSALSGKDKISRQDHKLFLFDYLLDTGDRNNTSDHNIIYAADGNLYAIDNESTLSNSMGGDYVNIMDIKQQHIDLFFEKEITKIKFLTTDWSNFFDKHTSKRTSDAKTSFLERIELVKQRLTSPLKLGASDL